MSIFDPTQRLSESERIVIGLYRIAQALQRRLRERGQERGLSPAQVQALLFLKYARPGVRTIGGLARRLGSTDATASGVADALERKGLILRRPLPGDQRTITLTLTPAGENECAALEDLLDDIEEATAALPAGQRMALLQATQVLVHHLQRAGLVTVYEMCDGCCFFRPKAHPEDDPLGPHHCAWMDAPLSEAQVRYECPDFLPAQS